MALPPLIMLAAWLAGGRAGNGPDELGELGERVRARGTSYFEAKDRRAAVRRLAGLDRVPAWELVLEALADPVPMVADEAEVQLAGLRYVHLVEELAGTAGLRSRAERVPERAAQVFGRLTIPVDPEPLARALKHRHAAVRRMALWSLERLAARGLLGGGATGREDAVEAVVRRLGKERDPGVRAAGLAALAVLAPDTEELAERIADGLEAREPAMRCAAIAALGASRPDEAVARLAAREPDPSLAVRTQHVQTLAALRTPEAARALVELLEAEPELRLQWRIVTRLRELSARHWGPSPEPWRRWAAALEPDAALPAEPHDDGGAERGAPARRSQGATFAELSLRSERLAFLVDFSGSIQKPMGPAGRTDAGEPGESAPTRREYLEAELARALGSLDERTHFNLVPYSDEPDPWQDGLVEASPRRVKQALEFFGKHRRTGRGDFWEAALLALEDPELDTVVVFTDGAPTGGERWHLGLMVDLLLERNRFRHVTFDAILVDAPPALQDEWRRLARATDGTVVVLEPDHAGVDEPGREGTRTEERR